MFNFVISTVPADGLVPLGAEKYVGTTVVRYWSCICANSAFEELKLWGVNEMATNLAAIFTKYISQNLFVFDSHFME